MRQDQRLFIRKDDLTLQPSLQAVVRIGHLLADPESDTGRINDSITDLHLRDIFSTYRSLWHHLHFHLNLNGGDLPNQILVSTEQ